METNQTYINAPTPTVGNSSPMMPAGGNNQGQHTHNNKVIAIFIASVVLIIGLMATLYIVRQQQNTKQNASGPVCPVKGATCSWTGTAGISLYHYKIVDITDNNTVLMEGDAPGTSTSVQFTSEAGKTYACTVHASNTCGAGPDNSVQLTCPAVPTPTTPVTETPVPSSTPSGTLTPTETGTPSATATITVTPTQTVTPTPVANATATPTQTPVILQNGDTATPTLTSEVTAAPTITVAPTGPGDVFINVGIIGMEALLVGSLILLAL